jgi:hypothetical protein
MPTCSSSFLSSRLARVAFPVASLLLALFFGLKGAGFAPDAGQYRLLALGQQSAVPAPFSARILGPGIAGWLGRATGLGVDTGFLILGVASLAAMLALVATLLWRIEAPLPVYAAIFFMPFWVDIFHDYYLPDPLHGAILAAILLCLLLGYSGWAVLLLLPAYLARESTSLVVLCLIFACWRRVPLRTAALGLGAVVGAGLISRTYAHGGPGSVHQLTGGPYILGKMVWSFCKNVIGVPLWSNTLPECQPVQFRALPAWLHLGAIREIGFCSPSSWGPSRTLLAWFGVFGIGPAVAWMAWRLRAWRNAGKDRLPGESVVLRFCIVYGLISILMTPLLGASGDRLVEYGWPFYFVALPWLALNAWSLQGRRAQGLVILHLVTCWLAWWAFRQMTATYVWPGLTVLALNLAAYGTLRRAGKQPM